jgi:hypothetical protein
MRNERIKYKNSILKILYVSSYGLWGSLLGLLLIIYMFLNDYKDNLQIDDYLIKFLLFIGFLFFIWAPILVFCFNYFMHTFGKFYTIDLNTKTINWYDSRIEKHLSFQGIKQIRKIRHISHKREIEEPLNFADRLENKLRKGLLKMPWSDFSYTKIFGINGELIIITSLMTNYNNFPFGNLEVEYVKFPWIRHK